MPAGVHNGTREQRTTTKSCAEAAESSHFRSTATVCFTTSVAGLVCAQGEVRALHSRVSLRHPELLRGHSTQTEGRNVGWHWFGSCETWVL